MSWPDALAAYADRLAVIEAAVTAGLDVTPEPFQPPSDLGPLPFTLADQARALLRRSQELEAVVAQKRDEVKSAIRGPRTGARRQPLPTMLDMHA